MTLWRVLLQPENVILGFRGGGGRRGAQTNCNSCVVQPLMGFLNTNLQQWMQRPVQSRAEAEAASQAQNATNNFSPPY